MRAAKTLSTKSKDAPCHNAADFVDRLFVGHAALSAVQLSDGMYLIWW